MNLNDNKFFSWRTTPPMKTTLWGLAGHECSYSLAHSDSSGFCTYVKIIEGKKLWFVGSRRGHIKSSEDVLNWACAELKRGDQLIMNPGTPHIVITTEDCFCVGAHFFNLRCMSSTVEAIVNEHFLGTEWTNDEYPTAPITLFKLTDDIYEQVSAGNRGTHLILNLCQTV